MIGTYCELPVRGDNIKSCLPPSAVRMARLSARLGLRLANQDESPRLHDDALIKHVRGVPIEPYFYSDELVFLTRK